MKWLLIILIVGWILWAGYWSIMYMILALEMEEYSKTDFSNIEKDQFQRNIAGNIIWTDQQWERHHG